MVVKPRISVRSASAPAASMMKPTSAVRRAEIGRPAKIACQCASIRPGMSVRPPQSMASAPAGGEKSSVASVLIRPPSTRRRSPPLSALDLPSNSRKFEKTTGRAPSAACALARGEKPREARDAPTPAMKPRRESSRSMRRAIERTCGVQQLQPTWGAASALSSAGVHAYMSDPWDSQYGERPLYPLAGPARKKLGHDRGAPLFTIR